MPNDDMPPRSWQSALRQLADTLAPGANVEIDPMDPEVSCARIAEAVGHRIAELELERDCEKATTTMAVARLGGTVEGRPTERVNFLQRIDELRKIEYRHHYARQAIHDLVHGPLTRRHDLRESCGHFRRTMDTPMCVPHRYACEQCDKEIAE